MSQKDVILSMTARDSSQPNPKTDAVSTIHFEAQTTIAMSEDLEGEPRRA